MKSDKVIIKKYENRRLYDTSRSRYVNLDDLTEMVRQGTDLQVVDAKTGEDLTRVTLAQIIMEDAKDEPAGLPLELLRQLIVASDRARQDFIMWYLKSAFDSYQTVQEAIQNQLSGVRSAAPAGQKEETTEVDELRRRVVELEGRLERKKRGVGKSGGGKKKS
jgi:polyhydroxyalkanoate synthesis repressor PhaR